MNIQASIPPERRESPALKPFLLNRDALAPELEHRRGELDRMYAPTLGRPEIDPVFLLGVTLLQLMERRPDRQAVHACLYDIRWRLALDIAPDWRGMAPTTLVYFRKRLAKHQQAKPALQSALEAMRKAGHLKKHGAVRIDSTHMLAALAAMSRLECVRETPRLCLEFLGHFGGATAWEPWMSRYAERQPNELRHAPVERLKTAMETAGIDCAAVLAKAEHLGPKVGEAGPAGFYGGFSANSLSPPNPRDSSMRRRAPCKIRMTPTRPGAQTTRWERSAGWATSCKSARRRRMRRGPKESRRMR